MEQCAQDQYAISGSRSLAFQYEALDLNRRTIRLLDILPPDDDSHGTLIKGYLEKYALEDAPTYVALSYTWDTTSVFDYTIECNGAAMRVGKNLWSFLQRYKHEATGKKPIWIDAICIDQMNNSERNHQVSQMRQIYSTANSVIVWLGALAEAAQKFCILNQYECGGHPAERAPIKVLKVTEDLIKLTPYWTRVWITQEFILAKTLLIWCGERSLSDEFFHGLLRRAYRRKFDVFDVLLLFSQRHIWQEETSSSKDPFSLAILLYKSAPMRCSILVDRIYGLLGIAANVNNSTHPIQIDYSKSPMEVFEDVVRNQCRFDGSMHVSSYGRLIRRLILVLELPQDAALYHLENKFPEFKRSEYVRWRQEYDEKLEAWSQMPGFETFELGEISQC